MNDGEISKTALRVAMRRAAHQLLDANPVFADPLALPILGAGLREHFESHLNEMENSTLARGMRAFFAARSRIAEDALAAAVERGVSQYVVLGAGLDTFAYRNPFPRLRVFEVDFPATQEWKRKQLREANIVCPPNLAFAPIDFERQTLEEGLNAAGLDRSHAAFFSCLGVIPYLTDYAVMRTFLYAGSFPAETGMTFDYALPREQIPFMERIAYDAIAARVAAAGEPFRFFGTPETLSARLRTAGFTETSDLDSQAIRTLYFTGRSDQLTLRGSAAHIMTAWVNLPPPSRQFEG